MTKLIDIAIVAAGQSAPQNEKNYSYSGTPFIKAGNLAGLILGMPEDKCQKVSEKVAKSHKLKLYTKGTIVFAKSGMSCMKGYVYILQDNCYVVSHLACISLFSGNSKFLKYYFQYFPPNRFVKDSSYPSISLKDISDIELKIPDIIDQNRIVNILDKISQIIMFRKQQIEKIDLLVKSQFIEMFGDPVKNPLGWETMTLRKASLRLSDGPFGSNLKTEHYRETGVRVIRLQNIGVGEFIDKDKVYVSNEHHQTIKKYTCKVGDIVIGTLGEPNLRACIIPESLKIAINKADCVHYIPRADILNTAFVCQYINCPSTLTFATGSIHGNTRQRISSGQAAELPIFVPPIELQNQFAAFVQQVDKSKFAMNQSLERLEQCRNALMQKAFG